MKKIKMNIDVTYKLIVNTIQFLIAITVFG